MPKTLKKLYQPYNCNSGSVRDDNDVTKDHENLKLLFEMNGNVLDLLSYYVSLDRSWRVP